MNNSFWTTLNRYLDRARHWYEETPERALDQAYDAVLMIKAIEDEHFDGKTIPTHSKHLSENTLDCLRADLKNYLKIADLRLSEFKASRYLFRSTDFSGNARSGSFSIQNRDRASEILEKLKFIDQVLDRYKAQSNSLALVPVSQPNVSNQLVTNQTNNSLAPTSPQDFSEVYGDDEVGVDDDRPLNKTGVLPRSIAGTINRIRRDLDPNAEQQVVQSFRSKKSKTLISVRLLLLLIIIPLLTQQLSKTFIIGPIVDHFRSPSEANIFLNFELEEEALQELQTFKQRLEFDQLLPSISRLAEAPTREANREPAERQAEGKRESKSESKSAPRSEAAARATAEEKLADKVKEIAEVYYNEGTSAIKNVFADIVALVAFAFVVVSNQRAIAVLKSFIDETVYGLSDSAKAFIIILFTDMFVGFHSPHGWEVLLEGVARHFGLPANRDFIFLFIATFPVILDTIFKYWIFRYLNRISPSAVATYRNMNE